jgi:hypothetical protein
MSLIVIPNTFTVGAVIVASQHNANFSTIYSDYNGNITNDNISGSAAIADTKLAQITTAGKLSGAAFTSLSSIPAGAGVIPVANLGTSPAATKVLKGSGAFALISLGTKTSGLSGGVVYQAASDGLVIATISTSNGTAEFYTDSSNPPTTNLQSVYGNAGGTIRGVICYPVKSGDYYTITLSTASVIFYEFWPLFT